MDIPSLQPSSSINAETKTASHENAKPDRVEHDKEFARVLEIVTKSLGTNNQHREVDGIIKEARYIPTTSNPIFYDKTDLRGRDRECMGCGQDPCADCRHQQCISCSTKSVDDFVGIPHYHRQGCWICIGCKSEFYGPARQAHYPSCSIADKVNFFDNPYLIYVFGKSDKGYGIYTEYLKRVHKYNIKKKLTALNAQKQRIIKEYLPLYEKEEKKKVTVDTTDKLLSNLRAMLLSTQEKDKPKLSEEERETIEKRQKIKKYIFDTSDMPWYDNWLTRTEYVDIIEKRPEELQKNLKDIEAKIVKLNHELTEEKVSFTLNKQAVSLFKDNEEVLNAIQLYKQSNRKLIQSTSSAFSSSPTISTSDSKKQSITNSAAETIKSAPSNSASSSTTISSSSSNSAVSKKQSTDASEPQKKFNASDIKADPSSIKSEKKKKKKKKKTGIQNTSVS